MSFPANSIIILVCLCFAACSDVRRAPQPSRVAHFKYGICEATHDALLFGEINTPVDSGHTAPLRGVVVLNEANDERTGTDENGQFVMNFRKGKFSLLITKNGYQPLRVLRFMPADGQVCDIKVTLIKGKDLQTCLLEPNPGSKPVVPAVMEP